MVDIKEKIKISDWANTGGNHPRLPMSLRHSMRLAVDAATHWRLWMFAGCYCFKHGGELARYCNKIISAGEMQLSQVARPAACSRPISPPFRSTPPTPPPRPVAITSSLPRNPQIPLTVLIAATHRRT